MRIFIAGATGALGRTLLSELEPLGHEIVGLARTAEKATLLKSLGVEPVAGSLLEPGAWAESIRGSDAVINLATAVPRKANPRPSDWRENDVVRIEGARNLVAAAKRARVSVYLQHSTTLLHGNHGDAWVDEDAPVHPNPVTRSAWEMEKVVDREILDHGFPAVLLRLGILYGPGSWFTDRMIDRLRQGRYRTVGSGKYFWSLLHMEDAARAFVAMLEEQPVGDTILFCDDEPVRATEFATEISRRLHADPPRDSSSWIDRLRLGSAAYEHATMSLRIRNRRARRQHGWKPAYPTYREGVPATVRTDATPASHKG